MTVNVVFSSVEYRTSAAQSTFITKYINFCSLFMSCTNTELIALLVTEMYILNTLPFRGLIKYSFNC